MRLSMPASTYLRIKQAVTHHGLALRGGFRLEPEDGLGTGTMLLVGHVGRALWPVFEADQPNTNHPLEAWTRATLAPIAEAEGATLILPNDGPPYLPFQQWAMRAEPVHPSPLGILIHPEWGLWHAYRAAIVLDATLEIPARDDRPSPCDSCADKPCLSTCPVSAFNGHAFNADRCAAHLTAPAGTACRARGCRARLACPIGREHAYDDNQQAFHMAAFLQGMG